jgi:hypothetical protein
MIRSALAISLLWAASAPAANPIPQPTTKPAWEQYAVISQRNIFLRQRAASSAGPRPGAGGGSGLGSATTAPSVPEASFVLRGVVFENGETRAYIEDLGHANMLRLGLGDAVARGTISQIDIDAVEYERDGEYLWVEVGCNLTGAAPTGLPSMPSGISATQPAAPVGAGNGSGLSIEEQMRQRRRQLLGQQ